MRDFRKKVLENINQLGIWIWDSLFEQFFRRHWQTYFQSSHQKMRLFVENDSKHKHDGKDLLQSLCQNLQANVRAVALLEDEMVFGKINSRTPSFNKFCHKLQTPFATIREEEIKRCRKFWNFSGMNSIVAYTAFLEDNSEISLHFWSLCTFICVLGVDESKMAAVHACVLSVHMSISEHDEIEEDQKKNIYSCFLSKWNRIYTPLHHLLFWWKSMFEAIRRNVENNYPKTFIDMDYDLTCIYYYFMYISSKTTKFMVRNLCTSFWNFLCDLIR